MMCLTVPLIFGLQKSCIANDSADIVAKVSDLIHARKLLQAETVLRSAEKTYPESAEIHGILGKLLFDQQKYQDAVQELNLAEQLAPESREYSMLLAAALLGSKRYGVAVNFLQAVRSSFEKYPEFHYSLGLGYYNLAQFTRAKEEFEETLHIDANFDRANFLLANCVASEGNFNKAAEMLRRLIGTHPENPIYWTTLGDVLRQAGSENRPEALRACRRALELQPDDPHTQFVMATILIDDNDFAGARQLLEHLESVSPKELEAHVALARIYARMGLPDLARKEKEIVDSLRKQETYEDHK